MEGGAVGSRVEQSEGYIYINLADAQTAEHVDALASCIVSDARLAQLVTRRERRREV